MSTPKRAGKPSTERRGGKRTPAAGKKIGPKTKYGVKLIPRRIWLHPAVWELIDTSKDRDETPGDYLMRRLTPPGFLQTIE